MGELLGVQMQPREIAALCYKQGWTDAVALTEAVMVSLSESQGYTRAKNDNMGDGGQVLSRDCGIFQINIPASKVGSPEEERLYDPVYNVERAWALYTTRKWQPWYAYTKAVYLRDTYMKRATRGVGNYLGELMLARTPTDTLAEVPYEHKLTVPVLDYTYRVVDLKYGLTVARSKARQIKPYGGPVIDKLADEIIAACTTAFEQAKK